MKATGAAETFFTPRLRTVRESAFWVLAGLSLVLLLALESYNPADPAYSVSGSDAAIANRMGPVGAWFADVAFFIFGRTAFLFPLLVLLAGVHLFRPAEINKRVMWLRAGGFALTIAPSRLIRATWSGVETAKWTITVR